MCIRDRMTTGLFDGILVNYCQSLDLPIRFTFVNNPLYRETNYIYSIYCAREHLDDDIVLMHGDLVFENTVIDALLAGESSCMAVDVYKRQAYTLRGSRKRDYPPSLHVQQPWFTEYAGFNDTFSRLGSALAQGSEEAEVLLLEPMQAASAVYDRRDPGPAMAVNRGFEETSVRLDGLHIGHH